MEELLEDKEKKQHSGISLKINDIILKKNWKKL